MIYTPNNIKSLKPNEVFVFGSNITGQHGAGAAKIAMGFGARWGKGVGLSGQTYGIPTKYTPWKTLPLPKIKEYVTEFLTFAVDHSELTYLVTEIGCGYAGYTPQDIAPLFEPVKTYELHNIILPKRFVDIIENL